VSDAGVFDAGRSDAGRSDAGRSEGGRSDGGRSDGWRYKGLWLPWGDVPLDDLVGQTVTDGPFTWPLLVARDSALRHNIATFAEYVRDRGAWHAPHGKTSMAPSLFAAQLAEGAWGLTAATANQALVYTRFGVPRILLANELLDPRALAWLVSQDQAEILCYVDSVEGVTALADAVAARAGTGARGGGGAGGGKPVPVLVELGFPGGRTGCRSVEQAAVVARAAAATGHLDVKGVAGFEGIISSVDGVRDFLRTLAHAAHAVADLVSGTPILSAGGSVYFDLVMEQLSEHGQVVVRSGAYVTHDHGTYAARSPLAAELRPALELWTQVLSTPEPGLAIVGMGKRDAPYDEGMPVPLTVDGRIVALNDQHGYLHADGLRPGDLVRFGISHPCSAFDRWQLIPVIDDDDRVVDLMRTYF
jgi:D-serine deaminase-like pyridoxal phosphate-dependent protein